MADDDLAMQEARWSEAMVLTWLILNILVSAPEGFS